MQPGNLVDFWSDDRLALSNDGKSFTRMRWSTPVRDYRAFGAHRLAVFGEGHWHPQGAIADGEFAYARFKLLDISYNMTSR